MADKVFDEVVQIGFVVDKLEPYIEQWKALGLEDWTDPIPVTPEGTPNMLQRGEPIEYETRIAMNFDLGLQIELIEPVTDNSIYAEFLREHGPGLHHLQISGPSHGALVKKLEEISGEGPLISGGPEGAEFRYFNTQKQLGFIAETFGDISE
jgi:methylmalonyl-CoA/ethylmalonyl-CoA epimerase